MGEVGIVIAKSICGAVGWLSVAWIATAAIIGVLIYTNKITIEDVKYFINKRNWR